jgi:hypothetical protein
MVLSIMHKAWIFWLRQSDILHVLYVGHDDFEQAKAAALARVGGAAIEAHCELPSRVRVALGLTEGRIIPAHHLRL